MSREITLNINKQDYVVEVSDKELLADVLRDKLMLMGTKKGCGTGECGACTVLIDGEPVNSCMTFASRLEGKIIETIEGLGKKDDLHPIQKAFVKNAAVQCGFCAPGIQLTAKSLLEKNPEPTDKEIRTGIAGNICRCSGYVNIVKAIKEAGTEMKDRGEKDVL